MSNRIEDHEWEDSSVTLLSDDSHDFLEFYTEAQCFQLSRGDIIRAAKHFNLTPEDIEHE